MPTDLPALLVSLLYYSPASPTRGFDGPPSRPPPSPSLR